MGERVLSLALQRVLVSGHGCSVLVVYMLDRVGDDGLDMLLDVLVGNDRLAPHIQIHVHVPVPVHTHALAPVHVPVAPAAPGVRFVHVAVAPAKANEKYGDSCNCCSSCGGGRGCCNSSPLQ